MNEASRAPFSESLGSEIGEPEIVDAWGTTLVVAPHPDDESLGCGGAIALLRKLGREVSVLTMSDGTLSHPNSAKFPPARLRALRESEAVAALAALGVGPDEITFLRLRDRAVPDKSSAGFRGAVKSVGDHLARRRPRTVLVPWRRDPHPDHRASWQIVDAAIAGRRGEFRVLEYPIWLWEMAGGGDLPSEKNVRALRVALGEKEIAQKRAAVAAHASQTTDLIDDDPQGFRLSPEVLAHFDRPFEIYFEQIREEF